MAGAVEPEEPPRAQPAAGGPGPSTDPAPNEPAPSKTLSTTGRRVSVNAVVDNIFFVFGGLAAVWLAWIVLTESFGWGWFLLLFFLLF